MSYETDRISWQSSEQFARHLHEENRKLKGWIAQFKNVLWQEVNRNTKSSDQMNDAIESCTHLIGKTD